MAIDFRSTQIQTTQLISSGSSTTGAKIVFYDISGQDQANLNQGIIDPDLFSTSSIGTDIFVFVSGGIDSKDVGNSNAIAAFGGDVHISGNLTIDGTGGGGESLFFSEKIGIVEQSGSLEMSGSGLFKSGLTGALNELPDGSPYLIAGESIIISTASNGQIEISASLNTTSSLAQVTILDYATTQATSSNPASLGQVIFDASNYVGEIVLKSVLAAASSSVTASVQLLNVTSGALVHIGGGSNTTISSIGTTPTVVDSVDLRNVTNFSTGSAIYELQAFTSDASQLATVGGAEFRSTFVQTKLVSGSLITFGIVDFASTQQTSSNPETIGQIIFDASEYTSPINLRSVLSVTTGSVSASIRLFNATSGSLVEIGGTGVTELTSNNTSPEKVESVDLRNAANFSTGSVIYELQLFSSDATETAFAGGTVFALTGSLTQNLVQSSTGSALLFGITDYATTTNTSSNPESVGQIAFDKSNYAGPVFLKTILTTTSASASASLKLLNLDDQNFVEIGGSGVTELTSSNITATNVNSVNLIEAANFNANSGSNYELQLFSSDESIAVIVGGAVFEVTGKLVQSTTETQADADWVDNGGQLRTTSSVSITSLSEFAEDKGDDVFFFVSGTLTSGSAGDKVSVFGGSVRVSGNLAVGSGSVLITEDNVQVPDSPDATTPVVFPTSDPTQGLVLGVSNPRFLRNSVEELEIVNQGIRVRRDVQLASISEGISGIGNQVRTFANNSTNLVVSEQGVAVSKNELSSAEDAGTDTVFFVSGTITTGSATDRVAVFGGTTHVSGDLVVLDGTSTTTLTKNSLDIDGNAGIDSTGNISLANNAAGGNIITLSSFNRTITVNGLGNLVFQAGGTMILSSDDLRVTNAGISAADNVVYDGNSTAGNSKFISTGSTNATTQSILLHSLSVPSASLMDVDYSIIARGAFGDEPPSVKRFKRNLVTYAASASTEPIVLENTVFAPIPDVSGSSEAGNWTVSFTSGSSNTVELHVTGSTTGEVNWVVKVDTVNRGN